MTTLSIVLCIAFISRNANAIEVSTSLGTIRGVVLKSRLGKDFNAFRGIRYGKSPVDDLRFKNPQPAEAWKPNTFDATEDGPQCPQEPFNSADNSEDCLRLNVFTKHLYPNILKPVVVYIHPGAFYEFSALSKSFAGPEFLMDRDIVLVTVGYRLGALGFLATGTPDAPGNAGFKDQVLALRWVKQHIPNFGGDPNSVTLLGYSAGSVSVGFHMMSPMSKGLFHGVIAMSASPMTPEIYPENQLDLASKQAELVNCPSSNLNHMMQCLRKTPAEEFVKTFHDLYNFGLYMLLVIEKDQGQERFIVEDPTEAFQEGRFQRTPLIVGMTNDDFSGIAKSMLQDKNLARKLNDEWDTKSPKILKFERNTPRLKNVSTVLRSEYLQNQTLSNDILLETVGKLLSDAIIGFPVNRFAHLAARYVPVYYYRFSYNGRFSDFLFPEDTAYGSVHHDDLWYLLHNSHISPVYKKSDPEDKIVETLTRIVSQFAKTGNPNDPGDEYLKAVDWKPLDFKKDNFLEIGEDLVMNEGLFLKGFDIWKLKRPDGDEQSLDNQKLAGLVGHRRRKRFIWFLPLVEFIVEETIYFLARQAAKEAFKALARHAARKLAQELAKKGAKELAKKGAKELAKKGAKKGAKKDAKVAAKGKAKKASKKVIKKKKKKKKRKCKKPKCECEYEYEYEYDYEYPDEYPDEFPDEYPDEYPDKYPDEDEGSSV